MKDVFSSPGNLHPKKIVRPLSPQCNVTADLDVLIHNSGNNWGAPFEEYVPHQSN